MVIKWDYLSKLADYLRVDNNLVQAISTLKKQDLYLFSFEKQEELSIFKKHVAIRQFKYRLTLPALFYAEKWKMVQQNITSDTIVDFIITFKGKQQSFIDDCHIKFLSEKKLITKEEELLTLLVITMLPNWHMGVYPIKKGENKN